MTTTTTSVTIASNSDSSSSGSLISVTVTLLSYCCRRPVLRVVLSVLLVALFLLCLINEEQSEADVKARSVWSWSSSRAVEMSRRIEHMESVCARRGHVSAGGRFFTSDSKSFVQSVGTAFAVDAKWSGSIFCVNLKVGSSAWLQTYAQLTADRVKASREALNAHYYHGILPKIGVKSARKAEQLFSSGAFFTFMVVRHPFDRLLSAFRDRILDGSTWQSKAFVKQMLPNKLVKNVMDAKGRVQVFPTFEQFLRFVARSNVVDPHWKSFTSNCSPCLLKYSAIVKLESADEDQSYVMNRTRMAEAGADLGPVYVTKGGKSESVREEFYSKVTCSTLKAVLERYRADFELFEYDPKPFFEWCIKRGR